MRVLGREIHAVQLFIDRDRRPVAGVAGVGPRIVFPRVVAELARLRNRVEDPQALAGAHVVAADVALDVLLRARRAAGEVSGADDDDVVAERRRRVEADVGGLEIDAGLIDFRFEIDDAVSSERGDRHAGFRVELDHVIAGGDGDDALVTLAVRPVGEPSARALPRSRRAALPLVHAPHPQQLSARRIERDDGAAGACLRVHHVVDDDRHRLHVEIGARSEVVGLEAPRDAQVLDVVLVDLVERRVFRASRICRVGTPFAIFRARLGSERQSGSRRRTVNKLRSMRSPDSGSGSWC